MSAFDDVRAIRPLHIWDGVTARAVYGDQVTLSLIELEPGSSVPEHSHANEQVGMLIEGSLTFRIGEETGEVAPGGTWCIRAHVPHSVVAGPNGAVLAEAFAAPSRLGGEGDGGAAGGAMALRDAGLTRHRDALERAKARLDRLALYPTPVAIAHVRVLVVPALFRLPWFRRFDGYAAWRTILLRRPPAPHHDDLVCHELCHVWQMQHRPVAMPLSYLREGYEANRYEAEARAAVDSTSG